MANKNPVCKFPAKYTGYNNKTVKTKLVRLPEYLVDEIERLAQEIHQRRLAEGSIPQD